MGVIDGFDATWSQARQTYGEGTPTTGEKFDQSSTLNTLKSTMDGAAPGSRWSGGASEAYGAANTEHQRVIGAIGDLDKQLGTQVTNAANLVNSGRNDLDSVKKWVHDAAATTQNNQAGERMKMTIVSKGLGQLTEVINNTDGQMQRVKGEIDKIKGEYQALGTGQKFAQEGKGDKDPLGEEKSDEEKNAEEEKQARERAEQDVQDTLGGDEEAAGRVDEVIDSIEPGKPLSTEQGSYLSQMQAQMHGMSVERLHEVEQKLGDHKDVIGDSMQLMSNDDVEFPKTDTETGAVDDPGQSVQGGFDQLPDSVKDTLNSPDILHMDRLEAISGMVQDGDDRFQTNTDLDRGMLRKAGDVMDSPFWQQSPDEYPGGSMDRGVHAFDPTISKVFDAVAPDHGAIHDAITNGPGHIEGIDSDKFMEGVTHRNWADDGKAAGQLFEWTKDSTGPNGVIAAETAHAYAAYLGEHSQDLLALGGSHQIGDVNPSLVQAFSSGLMPYQDEMVEENPAHDTVFKPLDDLGSKMEYTKGLFAVIDTQPDAAREWNRAAYQNAMDMQGSFADYAREQPTLSGHDLRLDDLESSARLLGAIDGGVNQETLSNVQNGQMSADEALKNAQDAYNFKKDILGDVLSYAPGGDLITNTAAEAIVGQPPNEASFKFDATGTITDVGLSANEQSAAHQTTQAQYAVASQFVERGDAYIDPKFFNGDGSLKSPNQISADEWSVYDAQLTVAMSERVQINSMLEKFRNTLDRVNGIGN
ncbi:EspA/EspE family type VII secretion system effector [Mycolicibacterium sp. GCM10028919]|uniref:TPR repeat region-containing protein n=1 Tax=Mycolicibacterium sp. GCM10028919 TaxID=3273401 RepID=UPI00360C25DE